MRAHRRTAPRPIGPEADVHTYSITSFVSASSVGGPLCRVNSSVLLRARQIRVRECRSVNYYDEISTAHVAVLRCHLSLHHNRSERSCKGAAIVRFGSKADMCGATAHVRFNTNSGHVQCTCLCRLWAKSGHSVSSRFLRCSSSSRLLENNWAFLHITRAGSPDAGSHYIRWFISSRRSLETVRNGKSDVASSSPCVGRYTQGAPQRRLHRARKRPGRRRVDGAAQAGLVAVRTAPRS